MRFEDLFHIGSPKVLYFTDWVIELPRPELPPPQISLPLARQQYQASRESRLINMIEAQLPTTSFFYAFKSENKYKRRTIGQHVITTVYAYYEVEHWPKAKEHVQWTNFMIDNLKLDEKIKAQGTEVGLPLPSLPEAAIPMYKEMTAVVTRKYAMRALRRAGVSQHCAKVSECESNEAGLIQNPTLSESNHNQAGSVAEVGQRRTEVHLQGKQCPRNLTGSDGTTQVTIEPEAPQASDAGTRLDNSPKMVVPLPSLQEDQDKESKISEALHAISITSPGGSKQHKASEEGPPDPPALLKFKSHKGLFTQEFRIWITKNIQYYREAMAGHLYWAARTAKRHHHLYTRWIFSYRESLTWSYDECYNTARDRIHQHADNAYRAWRQHLPNVIFDEQFPYRNWLEKMFAYLLASVRYHDPIPADASPAAIRELNARHALAAAWRQQQTMMNWTISFSNELKARMNEQGTLRFRYEANDQVIDISTGEVQDLATFQDRVRKTPELLMFSPKREIAVSNIPMEGGLTSEDNKSNAVDPSASNVAALKRTATSPLVSDVKKKPRVKKITKGPLVRKHKPSIVVEIPRPAPDK